MPLQLPRPQTPISRSTASRRSLQSGSSHRAAPLAYTVVNAWGRHGRCDIVWISCSSRSHGSGCSAQHTRALSAIQAERVASPLENVRRAPPPTCCNVIPSRSASKQPSVRRSVELKALPATWSRSRERSVCRLGAALASAEIRFVSASPLRSAPLRSSLARRMSACPVRARPSFPAQTTCCPSAAG